jgi:hypothetical protein
LIIFAGEVAEMEYKSIISPKMKAVENLLMDSFVGMNHCISDTGRNLIVEVPKGACDAARSALKQQFADVALIRNAYSMMEDLHDFILVKPIISEAPVFEEQHVMVPELEKMLVDHSADKEFASLTEEDIRKEYQRAFEIYPVNISRLLRYAGRKGKKEEVQERVRQIDQERVRIVHIIQDFFRQEPVERAWIFGSFSRMEERPDSDIDILIDLTASAKVGLLYYAGIINHLEDQLGRKVDLVANGTVKPFALDGINRDKVLVYERA